MRSNFLIIFSIWVSIFTASAKSLNPSDFVYPVKDVARLYSANFGELRPDHFHAGIDIKTDGVEGKKVVAVADGYISRISLSPYGYGLALYVAHPNGTTSVYGHLSKFMDPVAEYVVAEQYRTKKHSVNLYCNSTKFVVKQGDVIALSGNSGGSFGPHLHFEIRDSATQDPLNVVAQGVITPRDTIEPLIMRLHYIEIDSLQGIARQAAPRSYEVVKDGVSYSIVGGQTVAVGRQGYFVLEASDRRNDVENTFGIYRLAAKIDEQKIFEYQMDRFAYSNTRYCNALSYYPLMINSRNEVLRLASAEVADNNHYTTLVNRGLIKTNAGQIRAVNIEVADDVGNISRLNFQIKGKVQSDIFVAQEVDPKFIIHSKRTFAYNADGIRVSVPASVLYESTIFSCQERQADDSTILSKVYKVLDASVPLHRAMTISIKADVPFDLRQKVGIVRLSQSGRQSFIAGSYSGGVVTATSRNAGEFYVVADTVPPTMVLGITEGSQQANSSYFTCKIADDLSGIKSYSATLNGQWIALNLDKGVLRHDFRSKPTGAQHTLVIIATDGVGNQTKITRNFLR